MSSSSIFLSQDSNKENNGAKLVVLVISCAVCLAIFMVILFGRRLLCCWRSHRHITAASTPHDSPEPRLAPSTVAALPTFAYQRAIDCSGKDNGASVQCAVCLCLAREGDMVRLLPKCQHVFHAECIDMWLHSHSTCPLCRSDVADSPNVAEKVEGGRPMAPPALPV